MIKERYPLHIIKPVPVIDGSLSRPTTKEFVITFASGKNVLESAAFQCVYDCPLGQTRKCTAVNDKAPLTQSVVVDVGKMHLSRCGASEYSPNMNGHFLNTRKFDLDQEEIQAYIRLKAFLGQFVQENPYNKRVYGTFVSVGHNAYSNKARHNASLEISSLTVPEQSHMLDDFYKVKSAHEKRISLPQDTVLYLEFMKMILQFERWCFKSPSDVAGQKQKIDPKN